MKKSFLVLICVVFLLSIVAVGALGSQPEAYDERIYTKSIVCKEYYYSDIDGTIEGDSRVIVPDADGELVIRVPYDGRGTKVTLCPQAYPLNANILDSLVKNPYIFQASTSVKAAVDTKGVVTFFEPGVVNVLIKPADGTSCEVWVTVIAR